VNRRVLVVDDSEVTRAILARTLRGAGFEVLEARDGAEGAMTALRERPAVVVTDLEMPTMDGFPLLRLLKADPASAHMPVLILTSHGEAASRYWGLRTGADAYLTKDHRPGELVETVARLVKEANASPRAAAAGPLDPQGIGPVEVLARVARHLDASLLQATVLNTLLERGMAANDFHEAALGALETLGQLVDVQLFAVAVAEIDAGMIQILLQDPVRQSDVEILTEILIKALGAAPGVPVEIRIGGERGAAAVDLERTIWLPLAVRDATGVLAYLPRDPHELAAATGGLIEALLGHLALVLDNARLSQRLHELSTIDGLTRQLNHRVIYDRLTEELATWRATPCCARGRRCSAGACAAPTCSAATAARSSSPCCRRSTSAPPARPPSGCARGWRTIPSASPAAARCRSPPRSASPTATSSPARRAATCWCRSPTAASTRPRPPAATASAPDV